MAGQLGALAALAEVQRQLTTTCDFSLRESNALFRPPGMQAM